MSWPPSGTTGCSACASNGTATLLSPIIVGGRRSIFSSATRQCRWATGRQPGAVCSSPRFSISTVGIRDSDLGRFGRQHAFRTGGRDDQGRSRCGASTGCPRIRPSSGRLGSWPRGFRRGVDASCIDAARPVGARFADLNGRMVWRRPIAQRGLNKIVLALPFVFGV